MCVHIGLYRLYVHVIYLQIAMYKHDQTRLFHIYIYIHVYMFNIKWRVLCMFTPFSSDIGISTHLGLQGAIPCEQWLPNHKCYMLFHSLLVG